MERMGSIYIPTALRGPNGAIEQPLSYLNPTQVNPSRQLELPG